VPKVHSIRQVTAAVSFESGSVNFLRFKPITNNSRRKLGLKREAEGGQAILFSWYLNCYGGVV